MKRSAIVTSWAVWPQALGASIATAMTPSESAQHCRAQSRTPQS